MLKKLILVSVYLVGTKVITLTTLLSAKERWAFTRF